MVPSSISTYIQPVLAHSGRVMHCGDNQPFTFALASPQVVGGGYRHILYISVIIMFMSSSIHQKHESILKLPPLPASEQTIVSIWTLQI